MSKYVVGFYLSNKILNCQILRLQVIIVHRNQEGFGVLNYFSRVMGRITQKERQNNEY